MRKLAQIISWLSLVGLIVPSLLYLGGNATLSAVKLWMLVFTVIWFVAVPIWMNRKPEK